MLDIIQTLHYILHCVTLCDIGIYLVWGCVNQSIIIFITSSIINDIQSFSLPNLRFQKTGFIATKINDG
jgi:hypothetical protein